MRIFYILLFMSLYLTSFSQTTVTINLNAAGDDASVDDFNPISNNPDEIEYFSGAWTISGTPVIWRNFFKFDLTCIPPNATIIDAKLSLFYASVNNFNNVQHSSLTNSNESTLQRVTSGWTENSITWNNQPTVTLTDQIILPQSTSSTQDYANLDVTAMAQQMVANPNMNFGFSLHLTNEVNYARLIFASGDHPNSQLHPAITITYTIPVSDCFTITLDSFGEDASVDNYNPANNNPDEIEYFSGVWTISGTPVVWRNFFKFRIPCDLTNSIIQSADLSLYYADTNSFSNANHSSLTNSNASLIQRVTSPWTESQVTWVNQPNTTVADQVTLFQSSSGTQDYTNIDVSAIVQQMVDNPTMNFGFSLKLFNEVEYARLLFASGDNPDFNSHPTLEICYTILTSINEVNEVSLLKVFPSPASSELTVQSEGLIINDIQMLDMQGRKVAVFFKKISDNLVNADVSGLSNGIYFLNVLQGENHKYLKVVVSRN